MARLMWGLSVFLLLGVGAQAQTITTVAGTGTSGFCGDGGPATTACLNHPDAVFVDGAGNLFIPDTENHRIRRVDAATGVITTVAGNGTPGFCGDGGPATSACLRHPEDVAVDAAGNLFIADTWNVRIRRVDAVSGLITTVAGNGTFGFCGDGRPATTACLTRVWGLAVDAVGQIYIADWNNNRIRKVDAAGNMHTVAGSATAGFCGDGAPAIEACLQYPAAVAVDPAGNLFVTDYGNHRIRKVDGGTGLITTVAGNGTADFCGDGSPATSACLRSPENAAVDAAGTLFIADSGNQRIRRVDGETGLITTVAGNGTADFCGDGGPPTSACLNFPGYVAVDAAGGYVIADRYNNRIRKVSSESLASLRLSKALLSGCLKTTGRVTLTEPAPAGGLVVALDSDNPHAVVPASITFKAGVLSKTFSIVTTAVAANESTVIEASVPGQVLSAALTLKPMAPKAVLLTPNPVTGGDSVAGTVTLECPAGPGNILVTLSSSKPTIATPTSASITVPVGATTGTFVVTTNPVTVVNKPSIKAKANAVTRSKALVVNPAP